MVEPDEDSNPLVAFLKTLPADEIAHLEELARLGRIHGGDPSAEELAYFVSKK